MPLQVLRYPEVVEKTGMCRATIFNKVRDGIFPAPIKIGKRSVGFLEHEIDLWLLERANEDRAR